MATTNENRGYTLALLSRKTGAVVQKLYLKPMALYVPSVSFDAVTTLVDCLGKLMTISRVKQVTRYQ